MSDFKTPVDFRKGSYRKYPYQDPTYLSFALLFDFYDVESSPLLAGGAESFLRDLADREGDSFYYDRLNDLQNFIKTLKEINQELPWFWQSLKGLERLQQYDPKNAYIGGDDAKLEIETLESLNLTISGLMHLYRRATFDERKWSYIIPANLRKFRMWVYVTEVRTIAIVEDVKVNGIPKKMDKSAITGFPSNFKPKIDVENKNAGISGPESRPYFLIGIKYCEFDLSSGTTIFADLSKNPEMAKEAITIKYEKIEKVEARVLNGIIKQSYAEGQLSPAPDAEMFTATSKTPLEFAKDKLKGKIDKASESALQGLKDLADSKKREALQRLRDETINRIPTFENVFSNIMRRADEVTSNSIEGVIAASNVSAIGAAVQANVNGIIPGSTIGQGLNQAAVNNLGNVYK
jgi:hypothetical protein